MLYSEYLQSFYFTVFVNILPLQSLSRDVSTEGTTQSWFGNVCIACCRSKSIIAQGECRSVTAVIHLGRSSQAWIEGVSVRTILASSALLAAHCVCGAEHW